MTMTADPAAALGPAIFDHILTEVNNEVLGRSRELRAFAVALLAKEHVFVLSRPGEAKTLMIDRFTSRIAGIHRFSTQLDAFAGDDALFGPWSVKRLMEDDVRARSAANDGIQYAHVAEIDELPRASGSTLSTLLRITNERQYLDAGRWVTAQLCTMIASANSLPWADADDQDRAADLAALWDRIGIRLWMPPTTDLALLRRIVEAPPLDPNPRQVLNWADVEAGQQAVAAMAVQPDALDAFFGMIRKLHKDHGLPVPSPRRTKLMLKLAAANAWLAGASTVDVAHLDILTTALPHTPDDQDAVDQVVLAVAAPNREQIRKEAVKAAALVVDYAKAVDIVEDAARTEAYVQAYTRAQKCALALTRLEQGATPADLDDINAVWPALQEVHARFTTERLNQTTVTDFRAEARAGRINVRYRG